MKINVSLNGVNIGTVHWWGRAEVEHPPGREAPGQACAVVTSLVLLSQSSWASKQASSQPAARVSRLSPSQLPPLNCIMVSLARQLHWGQQVPSVTGAEVVGDFPLL